MLTYFMTLTQPGAQVEAKQRRLNILLIGPSSSSIGGTTVLFEHLSKALESIPEVHIEVISSTGIRGSRYIAPVRLLRLMYSILRVARRCDVLSFHAMPTALPYIGWFLPLVAKYYRKPLIFRSFGGMYYDELSWPARAVARFFMRRANAVLLETKELMKKAADDHLRRTEWFPNARPMPVETTCHRGTCRRFVYVGQLRTAKGLQYLARAAEQLPDDASVDVYGPWFDDDPWFDLPRDTFDGCRKIRYVGVLNTDEVETILRQYDALVLPTFATQEGHAGIILEAYAVGIPVIATRWKALPEIVEDGTTGLLIEPQSDTAILQAMMRLYEEPELCRRLVAGAQLFRKRFSLEQHVDHFLRICRELATACPERVNAEHSAPQSDTTIEQSNRI
jgi:glycosyltransferase involved in cell wall biosynthesis